MRHVVMGMCVLAMLAAAGTGFSQGSEVGPLSDEEAPVGDAVAAVKADLDVESQLLEEDLQRYRALSARRGKTLTRLSELYQDLDRAVLATETRDASSVDALLAQIDAVEGERARLLATERALVEGLVSRGRRVQLLEEKVVELAGRQEEREGALAGLWDVVFLPVEQRGTFNLKQSGTLVTGTYRLAGGWTGSLQGTLVARKVFLVRIDSKLGKSMELEGFLSGDGTTIRGTWLNYELAGGTGSTGQWSASKH